MEISYAQDKNYGWIPSAWTTSLLNQEGKITWRDTATVSEFLINKPIDHSEFSFHASGNVCNELREITMVARTERSSDCRPHAIPLHHPRLALAHCFGRFIARVAHRPSSNRSRNDRQIGEARQ